LFRWRICRARLLGRTAQSGAIRREQRTPSRRCGGSLREDAERPGNATRLARRGELRPTRPRRRTWRHPRPPRHRAMIPLPADAAGQPCSARRSRAGFAGRTSSRKADLVGSRNASALALNSYPHVALAVAGTVSVLGQSRRWSFRRGFAAILGDLGQQALRPATRIAAQRCLQLLTPRFWILTACDPG